jgi:tetratricopeptide (TPR) repeat protein
MAAPNRVEELRKRYHENPRRFFAPLANEYRKTGFPDRAILLCEKHLSEQPDNLNGLVVYGQTLFESGRQADAKRPFEMALGIDPENLIALRHLGDIAKEEGDTEGARKWYERVLEFDRRNEEVLALLDSVGGPTEKEPPSGPSSAPSIVNVASSVSLSTSGTDAASEIGMIDLDAPAPVVEAPSAPSAPKPKAAASSEKTVEVTAQAKPAKRGSLMDIAFDFGEVGAAAAAAPPPTPAAPVLSAEAAEYGFAESPSVRPPALEDMPTLITEPRSPTPAMPMESLIELPPEPIDLGGVGRIDGLEAAEYESDAAPLPGLEPSEFQSGDVAPLSELESDAFIGLGADEPAPPPADLPDLGGTLAFSAVRLEELGPPPKPRPTDGLPLLEPLGEDEPEPASAALPMLDADPIAEAASSPKPFVTETMAELYLKQGHRDQAMDVYRQLIEQSPRDESLREKLAALEASGRMSLEFEAPSDTDLGEPTPAPANSMLAEMSFDDVALKTPARSATPARAPTPPRAAPVVKPAAPRSPTPPKPKPAVPSGPTAREYLGAFAKRGFTPLSSPVIPSPSASTPPQSASPVPGGGLDLLFGGEVNAEDDRAAHRLAGVGATSGPSGGTALDSLFGEGPSAPTPAALLEGRAPVQRASDKLRFDQFFTPPSEAASAEAPSAPMPDMQEPASAAAPEDDDLDQFQGWLRGLTQ